MALPVFLRSISRSTAGRGFAVVCLALLDCHGIPAGDEGPGSVPESVVVARVGERPIYRAALRSALQRVGFDRIPSEEQRLRTQAEVLAQLIDEQILRQLIDSEGLAATEAEIDAFISELETRLAPSRVSLEEFLTRSGRDAQSLRAHVGLEIGVNKLVTKRLTPKLLEEVFRNHRAEVDGSMVRVSHIVLRPDAARGEEALEKLMAKASGIRSEIVEGTISFADAAAKHSAGPSRRRGGDLGFLPRSSPMSEEFLKQVFTLRKGDVSKPFASPSGIHIATVTDTKPGRVSPDRMRPQLEKIAARNVLRELLDDARAKTAVVYTPGVAHFDDKVGSDGRPAVVVEPKPVGS